MKAFTNALAIVSLGYAQVYTHPDIVFITEVLGRYQDNPDIEH
jgi:hypothetical protein